MDDSGNKEYTGEVLDLQVSILKIFKEIKRICDEHGLRYYAIGGTCIGAVRHHGFIPWDDDLDIAFPKKDFDRFIKIAEKELPDNLKIRRPSDNIVYPNLFVKVHDINTTLIEEGEYEFPDYYKGISVDVMPFCGMPDRNKQNRFIMQLKLVKYLNYKRRSTIMQNRGIIAKFVWCLLYLSRLFISFDFWSKKWERIISKYDFDWSMHTCYCWWDISDNLIFEKSWFNRAIEIPFEDTTIRCPEGYDAMLTRQFGDYMKLPPIEQRITHKSFRTDISKPFTYYAQLKKEGKL